MTKIRLIVSRGVISSFALFFGLAATAPALTLADTTCTPPSSTQAGVHVPVGADSGLYTYDCATGLWASAHFSYDPSTGAYTPLDPIVYTYNPSTGLYDSPQWFYNAPSNAYVQRTVSVSTPPAGAAVVGAPAPAAPTTTTAPSSPSGGSDPSISNTGSGSSNSITNNGTPGGSQTINGTGPNSANSITGNNSNTLTSTTGTGITLGNNLTGQANSGAVALLGNTLGSNVTSGNAQDTTTVVNSLQSAAAALGSGKVVTFVQNINGDVNGDLLFDPATLANVQPATVPSGNNNITFNNSTKTAINNNINVGAQSGDVTVSQNTSAGNATSGAADAIANVVNLINSAVSAGKSFIGTININGNLNGDILIPPSFIQQLVATNVPTVTINTGPSNIGATGPGSSNTISNNGSSSLNATNTNNQGIMNNVKETAASGQANVSTNTAVGNVGTGNAANSITAFNLTGSNVIGANDLLVFVNVLGSWVGMIVNAPAGATAAEFCSGSCQVSTTGPNNVSNTGPDSNNSISNNNGNSLTANNSSNQTINNNINLAAQSGNANVNKNTRVGNVQTGNAKTGANLLNVQNSSFSLANWFGILFINVFGSWHGSFGTNTAAGNPVNTGSNLGTAANPSAPGAPVPARFFRFVPHNSNGTTHFGITELPTSGGSAAGEGGNSDPATSTISGGTVLAAHAVNVKGASISSPTPALQDPPHNSTRKVALIIAGSCLTYIVLDLLYTRRQTHKA